MISAPSRPRGAGSGNQIRLYHQYAGDIDCGDQYLSGTKLPEDQYVSDIDSRN
jgi:hypothetical protein